jgi:hypothetical protein
MDSSSGARRSAVGLQLARGQIIAMTEDHAVPAADWIREIRAAHERPYAVIGGAIENAVDRPLNWALYYCDFGRNGRPMPAGEAESVSDVNVSYKREALNSIRDVRRSPKQIIRTLPVAGILLTGWALGELIGYVAGAPREEQVSSQAAQRAAASILEGRRSGIE